MLLPRLLRCSCNWKASIPSRCRSTTTQLGRERSAISRNCLADENVSHAKPIDETSAAVLTRAVASLSMTKTARSDAAIRLAPKVRCHEDQGSINEMRVGARSQGEWLTEGLVGALPSVSHPWASAPSFGRLPLSTENHRYNKGGAKTIIHAKNCLYVQCDEPCSRTSRVCSRNGGIHRTHVSVSLTTASRISSAVEAAPVFARIPARRLATVLTLISSSRAMTLLGCP